MNIVTRIQSDVRMKVAPRLYSEQAFHANNGKVHIIDGLLIGGLFALTLSAFFLSLYSRRRELVLLGLTTLAMVLHEASSRGYAQIYLWPDAYTWSERASLVLAAISCSLFLCFAMSIVRVIDIKWPCKRYFQGLVLAPIPVAMIAMWGDSVLAGQLLTVAVVTYGFSLSLAALALLCLNRPGGNSLLLVALYFIFQVILRYASAPGFLPRWVDELTMNDNINNSVLGLIAFAVNLAILMAWVVMIGKQRVQVQAKLISLQEKEKEHLAQEVQRQTAALHKALRYADEKNRQKTETLGFISHDLRAPLATIVGYTRLLETNARPDQKPHIRAIEHGASYQMALIDDLMEYSHNELQPLSLAPAPLLLVNLLDDITQHAQMLAAQQENHFTAQADTLLPANVMVDGRRMQQVLLNLLSNAAKFTKKGIIRLNIQASPGADGHWTLEFRIGDTGIGMTKADTTTVFSAFVQMHKDRGGLGLGLFIAQRIVQNMGGIMTVKSAPGKGSEFVFTVPVKRVNDAMLRWCPQPAVSAVSSPPPEPLDMLLPPAAARMELAEMARDGRLTDIEEWLRHILHKQPACKFFVERVMAALQTLDLERIEVLALSNGSVSQRWPMDS